MDTYKHQDNQITGNLPECLQTKQELRIIKSTKTIQTDTGCYKYSFQYLVLILSFGFCDWHLSTWGPELTADDSQQRDYMAENKKKQRLSGL